MQWNAHSLSLFKAEELAEYAKRKSIDIACISELGPRRKIRGYQQYVISDTYTQSGIFWRNSLKAKSISMTCLDRKHDQTLTQCIMIEEELLLVHVYINPALQQGERSAFWRSLLNLLETKNVDKVIITRDLNTLDERFGDNHNQRYKYLDDVLNSYEIISNPKVCTEKIIHWTSLWLLNLPKKICDHGKL